MGVSLLAGEYPAAELSRVAAAVEAVAAVESMMVVGASVAGSVVPWMLAVDAVLMAGVAPLGVVALTRVVAVALCDAPLCDAPLCDGLRVVDLVLCDGVGDVLCGCDVAFLPSPTACTRGSAWAGPCPCPWGWSASAAAPSVAQSTSSAAAHSGQLPVRLLMLRRRWSLSHTAPRTLAHNTSDTTALPRPPCLALL